ncbi:MAG: phosphatidylglycerophosphatase A [Prevotella sp.]|nr:phosphatidylglycerophosphatase A [Prevotella sp.]
MSNNNNRQLGEAPWLHVVLSTGFGAGFVPVAPGTAGALVALIIWLALYFFLSPLMLLIATILLVVGSLLLGVWTDNVMERYWGADPRAVVIDEYFGTWVALLAVQYVAAPSYVAVWLAVIAFALFRIIDITKPLGCKWIDENIHGGWGCMLDDALAGAYAAIITLALRYLHVVERLHDLLF